MKKRSLILFLLFAVTFSACTASKKLAMISGDNPEENNPESVVLGKAVYSKNCISCHGESGKGDGKEANSLKTKPANLILIAKKKTANSLAANTMYGKGSEMPAFKDVLSEKEIWHVANYVYSLGKNK